MTPDNDRTPDDARAQAIARCEAASTRAWVAVAAQQVSRAPEMGRDESDDVTPKHVGHGPTKRKTIPGSGLIDGRHPFTVGVRAGGWDDAQHIVKQAKDRYTLCNMDASERNVVLLGEPLDSLSGCWSCLHAARTGR